MTSSVAGPSANAFPCELCGSNLLHRVSQLAVRDYITGRSFTLLECPKCGLISTAPMPDETELGQYYPSRYRGNRHSLTGAMRVALRQRALMSQLPRGFKGRLLDVGCGDGSFALAMQRQGWTVSATELDPATITRLLGLKIDAQLADGLASIAPDHSYDAITAWHVLEHVLHPSDLSRTVARLLKLGGVFQATVPNIDCWQARMFGRYWFHLDVPRHRYHFSPQTLIRMLYQAGMESIDTKFFAIEYDLFGFMQSVLNGLCETPNFLFDKLTGADAVPSTVSTTDRWLSYGLAGPLGLIGLPACVLPAILHNGSTLTITARSRIA